MNLEDVKVGDRFLTWCNYGFERRAYQAVVTCTKVTAKQCVIGGDTYRKSDGRMIGGGYSHNLCQFNEEGYKKGRKFLRRKKVENTDYTKLSDDQCERIYVIITKPQQPAATGDK